MFITVLDSTCLHIGRAVVGAGVGLAAMKGIEKIETKALKSHNRKHKKHHHHEERRTPVYNNEYEIVKWQ